jgi:hypothetical protein
MEPKEALKRLLEPARHHLACQVVKLSAVRPQSVHDAASSLITISFRYYEVHTSCHPGIRYFGNRDVLIFEHKLDIPHFVVRRSKL